MRPSAKIGLTAVVAVLVAEGAVWLLGPDDPIEPAAVTVADYFDPVQVERAGEFHRGQRLLFGAELLLQTGLLAALALGRPRFSRRLLERLESRPVLGPAIAGAGISAAVLLISLPTDVWSHERSVEYGLSVQSLGSWLGDAGRSTAINAALAGAGAALLFALIRRAPRAWPLPAAAGTVAIAVAFTWLAPVVLAPVFNDFESLPDESRVRAEVLELAERADVDVGEVYRVDASRRSTALNAYVDGIGPTKRVVLYDNLLDDAERNELRSVVAHELAHQAHNDIPRGIAFIAIVAPFGLFFARGAGEALARRSGVGKASLAALPAYILALSATSLTLAVIGNQLSRDVERSADQFALELTGDPDALIDLQQRLARANVSEPDPPGLVSFLLASHPAPIERIGAAEGYRHTLSP